MFTRYNGTASRIRNLSEFAYKTPTQLTIATGEITVTQSFHTIEGEGAAADDLDTINGMTDYGMYWFRPANASHNITVKHGTGNILSPSGLDYTIPDDAFIMIYYDGSNALMLGAAVGGTGGIGDVVGPGSATDNALVVFDGATGKLIKGASTDIVVNHNLITTDYIGRDSDNYLGWGTDDQLDIRIGGVTSAIVSISTGTGDNDKLVTKGYVDDAIGVENLWDRSATNLLPHTAGDDVGATGTRIHKIWATDIESTNMPTKGGVIIPDLLVPSANDAAALGASGTAYSDVFLALGGAIVWNAGACALTHSANLLTTNKGFMVDGSADTIQLRVQGVAGQSKNLMTWEASTGVEVGRFSPSGILATASNIQPITNDGGTLGISGTAWGDLFLASGGVINWNAGNATLTHAAGNITSNVPVVLPDGSAVAPSLQLGGSVDGFYADTPGTTVALAIAGTREWFWNATRFQCHGNGPALAAGTPDATTPALYPNYTTDTNTGFGWVTDDTPNVVAGGFNVMQWTTTLATLNTPLTIGVNNFTLTGYVGRDSDNYIGWGTDDKLDIRIGGVTIAIVSISTGITDNDKLGTKGYIDDKAGTNGWYEVATSKYTATPTDTDTLAMSDTGMMKVGYPVRYTIGGTVYYGQVVAVTANTSIDIVGASLSGSVTKLEVGQPDKVIQVPIYITGTYGDGVDTDLLANDMSTYIKWRLAKGYCVGISAVQASVDTGTEPKVNIQINNASVSTNDSNNGIQLGAAGTWVDNSAVAINTSNYDINFDESLEVECTVAGGTGDASDLTVIATFILE